MEKAKILIVEDDAIVALEIESSLKGAGYQVTSIVDTGAQAIVKADTDRPNLVLMDIHIKGKIDGVEAADEIRLRFKLPVVFSTTYVDEIKIGRAKLVMPFGYILKPIQDRDLKMVIEMALFVSKMDAERRKAEFLLKESEIKYQTLFKSSAEGFLLLRDKVFILCNEKACQQFACKCDYIIGKTPKELSPVVQPNGSLSAVLANKLLKKAYTGESPYFPWQHKKKNGDLFDLEISLKLLNIGSSRILQVMYRDMPEFRAVKKALNNEQLMTNNLVETANAMVIGLDNYGRIQIFNSVAEKLTGYLQHEVKNVDWFEVLVPKESSPGVWQNFGRLTEGVRKKQIINPILTRKGELRTILWSISEIIRDDKIAGTISFGIDITDFINQGKKLQQALTELEKLKEQLHEENVYFQDEVKLTYNFGEIIGKSPALKKVLRQVEQVAASDSTVLLLGETGTGKELLVRAVHNLSSRKNHPLIKVNCAAIPFNLIESELFGHEKGAFTGALAKKKGRFELAHKGTIFLDEIGDLPFESQAKLLRVLQECELEHLGDTKTVKIDARVLAATNKDLKELCAQSKFREDLFYRLNVFPIECPPLRKRKEDIPLLVRHFVDKYNLKMGKNIKEIPQKIIKTMQAYYWPGNIRELENIIERAIIISSGKKLMIGNWLTGIPGFAKKSKIPTLEDLQKEYILSVLNMTNWRIRGKYGASEILGIKPTTLEAKMSKFGIRRK